MLLCHTSLHATVKIPAVSSYLLHGIFFFSLELYEYLIPFFILAHLFFSVSSAYYDFETCPDCFVLGF